jgi:uncharacterized glyoxalase superfamily protein PhnB
MTDAFDALRRPDAPIAPGDSFASQLRRRLRAELQPMLAAPTTTARTTTARTNERMAAMTVTPYLSVRNGAAALDFYRDAFGAIETQRMLGDDGRVGHAEFTLGSSTMMLADEYPEIDSVGPESRGGPTCMFTLDVGSGRAVDETFARSVSLGAVALKEPADQFHGNRSATVTDPFGHRWTITALVEQLSPEEYAARAATDNGHGSFAVQTPDAATPHTQIKPLAQGDLYYFTLATPDMAKAKAFFGAVLGWQFGGEDQGHVENISAPPGAVNAATAGTGARLWFVVDDIHTAIARVRDHGGTAQDPIDYESGWSSDCTDDQGTVFSLSVPSPLYST